MKARRAAFGVLAVGVASLLVWGAVAVDALAKGPHARWFNERKRQQFESAGLTGKPEGDVERALGHASSVWRGGLPVDDGSDMIAVRYEGSIYEYRPCPLMREAVFIVRVAEGRVESYRTLRNGGEIDRPGQHAKHPFR